MVKVYTKSGDKGTTSLFGGQKVNKGDLRIEAYGHVDELNSLIGVIIADSLPVEISRKLIRVQNELFVLGSDLATPLDVSTSLKLRGASKIPRITGAYITRLEKEIDAWQKNLPQLKNFILPGGSKIASKIHLARAITRRVERSIADLSKSEKNNQKDLVYINRLSDWFFVLARFVNKLEKIKETQWKGRG